LVNYSSVKTDAHSYAKVAGLFGWLSSTANNTTTLNSRVVADPRTLTERASVTAGPRAANDPYLENPDDATLLTASPSATLDHLALFVDVTNSGIVIDRSASHTKRALAGGGDHGSLNNNQTRTINWNADVHGFSGQSPELEIRADGRIDKAVNVSVRTATDPAQTSGTITDPSIFVNDIRNDDPAQVFFDVSGSASGTGSIGISGSGSTWDFSDTFRQVLITNRSALPLTINNIDVVNTTEKPLVDLKSTSVTLEFALHRSVAPTLVMIQNLGAGDVTLNGTINNPIGATVIHNTGGGIRAARARGVGAYDAVSDNTRYSVVRTAILDLQATNPTTAQGIGSSTTRVTVDLVFSAAALPPTTFRPTDVSALSDSVYLGSGTLFTGELVRYATTGTAIGGVEDGEYYVVVRTDGARIQLKDLAGTLVQLDPSAALAAGGDVTYTLTPVRHVVGVATGNLFLDLKARLRQEDPVTEFTATIDSLRAGGTIDVLLQDSVQESGAATSAGVRVTTLVASPAGDANYTTYFRPDQPPAPAYDIGAFGGTETQRASTYDFRDVDPTVGSAHDRTGAGLIAGNNVIIAAVSAASAAADHRINILALTELHGTGTDLEGAGRIDILTNGWIGTATTPVADITGNLRVGTIQSNFADVFLAAPERILDVEADAAADVIGVNLTMTAGTGLVTGGIGTPTNFLETNVDLTQATGTLNAFDRLVPARTGTMTTGTLGIFLTETIGDLTLDTVWTSADASLATLAGSVVDGRNNGAGDSEANVVATSIDIAARGTGANIGSAANDLEIESSHAMAGDVGLEAAGSIWLTETRGTLHLVLANALGGDIVLTVRETVTQTPD
ncbi:MAG: hypothetical protein WCF12_12730, partial [Propionicimonas sp.]